MTTGQIDAGEGSAESVNEAAADSLSQRLETMGGESDRGCLLVGLSEIDNRLEEMLLYALTKYGAEANAKWLLDAKAGSRPLGTLAVRTRIARCLGLITDQLENVIDELRGIRNIHAHGTSPLKLTAKDIAPVMDALPPLFCEELEKRVAEKPEDQLVINKLRLTFGFISVMLERCLANAKDYSAALQHLLEVSGRVTGIELTKAAKREDERHKPGVS
ncbi:MAG TPA: hypothetical protein VGK58_20140 [Lacipirellulaceae bacterium]